MDKGIQDGEIVTVVDIQNNYLAKGHYQSGTSIAVRVLTTEEEEIDATFWSKRLKNAFDYRKNVLNLPNKETNAFRLIHGEGDRLPGLIIDVYHDTAVVQCHSLGMVKVQDLIKDAILQQSEGLIKYVFTKNKESLPNGQNEDQWLTEEGLSPIKVKENGHTFLVDVVKGQKTGFFLDQRDNRNLVGHFSINKSVLNCFCYTGGFSVYALNQGASKVTSVDISQTAMTICDQNVSETPFSGNHESETANVLEYLKSDEIPQYDIVIVDPPAFAKSVAKRHNAVQAYKRLNALALQKVVPGGLLFTFSCSQVVGSQLFYDTIVAAAIESGRAIRVMHHLSQGADHPVNLFHPEGHYLKGLVLYVE
jgi:23S rRNA (cytosine1962-C5)-methyltransferase